MTKDIVFRNTFEDLEYFCKTMIANDTKPELEIYDVGHIYNATFLVRSGVLNPPLHMQFVTGVLGGIGNKIDDLYYLKNTADRLIGASNYTWSVIGVGYPAQFHLGAMSIMMGGHVRAGLEDNLFIERRVLAKSNAEIVTKIVQIAKLLGREVAKPDEARKILGLKGLDKVNF